MESYNKADLKNSFYEGIFAHMFATLTVGIFLTGFGVVFSFAVLIGIISLNSYFT